MTRLLTVFGLLLVSFSSLLKAEINTLDTEIQVLQQACPVRWQSLDIMMNAEQIEEGDIWADESDFLAWQSYLTSLAQAQGLTSDDIIRMSRDELTVITECMAQRVKVMLMLGGTPLGESGLAYLNDSEIIAEQPVDDGEVLIPGTLSTYPADSCLQAKEAAPQAKSDFYWVKLNSLSILDTYRVFCQMEHDGGGWMYWGYIGSTAQASNLFDQPLAGYDAERRRPIDTLAINNLFSLNQYADTEMIIILDTPDIVYAQNQNKYVRYRYSIDSVTFNNGPLPCQSLEDGAEAFEYTKNDVDYKDAEMDDCTADRWYPKRTNGDKLTRLDINKNGVYWGDAMGGNNSWSHDAWIYIR